MRFNRLFDAGAYATATAATTLGFLTACGGSDGH